VAVIEGSLLPLLAPEDLVVAVRVKGRVNVDEVHAGVGPLGELHPVVAAIDDAGVEERGGFARRRGRPRAGRGTRRSTAGRDRPWHTRQVTAAQGGTQAFFGQCWPVYKNEGCSGVPEFLGGAFFDVTPSVWPLLDN